MLVALSSTGINAMLDICNSYSKKWRYEYNASKCSGVVFNESAKKKETRCFKLGDNTINETRDYTHLGIVCDSFLTDRQNVDNACSKLRGTMLSLLNNGINPDTNNPLTLWTLYYSCIIPTTHLHCELCTIRVLYQKLGTVQNYGHVFQTQAC